MARTIQLAKAQAFVCYLSSQRTEIDSERMPLSTGVFGIFGHSNVPLPGEALESAGMSCQHGTGGTSSRLDRAQESFLDAATKGSLRCQATDLLLSMPS